jgi:hypothetical protein
MPIRTGVSLSAGWRRSSCTKAVTIGWERTIAPASLPAIAFTSSAVLLPTKTGVPTISPRVEADHASA